MIACWINHKDGYTLMDDSGTCIGALLVMDDRILGRKLKASTSLLRGLKWMVIFS